MCWREPPATPELSMLHPERVFLVPSGYNFRAVLAFCRALEAARCPPAIIACTAGDPVFRTRYARYVVHTRTQQNLLLEDFAIACQAARVAHGANRVVLAPASEYLVRWALSRRTELAATGCDLPLPDKQTYLRVTEKQSFTAFCRELGLLVPAELAGPEHLPCVAKPRWNVSPDGRSLYPWLLRDPAELARFKSEARRSDFFFQEWVEGKSYYLLYHIPRHGVATAYSQENLAQQPGGKSVLFARTARLHETPEAERWEQALRAAGFHGVVMVELRQRGSQYVMIEANPRLWGPLQLCVDGCPALLRNYLAEHLGLQGSPTMRRRASVAYGWSGGWGPSAPVWHGGQPRFPRGRRLRYLASDVYLRPDSWRQFLFEHFPLFARAARPAGGKRPAFA